jgi:hypothetical protein
MKVKTIFYLLIAVFILSFASCSKEEHNENTDCGCEQQQEFKHGVTQSNYSRSYTEL